MILVLVAYALVSGCVDKPKKASIPDNKPVETAEYIMAEDCIVVRGVKFYLEDSKMAARRNNDAGSAVIQDSAMGKYTYIFVETLGSDARDCWILDNLTKRQVKLALKNPGIPEGVQWYGDAVLRMDYGRQRGTTASFYRAGNPGESVEINDPVYYDLSSDVLIYGDRDSLEKIVEHEDVFFRARILVQKGLFKSLKQNTFMHVFSTGSDDVNFNAKDSVLARGILKLTLENSIICVDLERLEVITCPLGFIDESKDWLNGTEGHETRKEPVSEVAPIRSSWILRNSDPGFGVRSELTCINYKGRLWVIAGMGNQIYYNDIWNTSDGTNWECVNKEAEFSARYGHSSVVFNDKMWVIGGYTGQYCDDVWYSSDAQRWTRATAEAGFGARADHTSVVFKNAIWVIGGSITGPTIVKDVWKSTDGEHWELATASPGFAPRRLHTSVVFDGRMWVIGGNDWNALYNDVWYSYDGVKWSMATEHAPFKARYVHTSFVFDNKIWVVAGADSDGYMNDSWYTTDGKNWIQAEKNAAFVERAVCAGEVFNGKMWLIGGAVFKPAHMSINEVWSTR